MIRSQNVYNGQFTANGLAHIGEDHAEELRSVTVEKSDVLLNITGDSVARSCLVPEYVLPARVNQHVAIIRPNPEDFDSRFVAYYLISPQIQATMLSLAGGGGTRKALTKEMVEGFDLPRPPRYVQTHIADILSVYDDLIENSRRRIALLEDSALQLYREWFVRLRFPGYEHTPKEKGIPKKWERMPFENALVLQRGFDLPIQAREDGDVPVLGSTGPVGFHSKARVKGPGVVTGRSGTLGEVHFTMNDFWPLNTALWVKEFRRLSPFFALFLMREMDLAQYNGGASVPTLDRKAIHRVNILLPPKPLLMGFDDFAAPVFKQISNLRVQEIKLRAARDLLLSKLMNGEIAV